MNSETEKHIPYSDNSYLSEFFDAMKRQDSIKSNIATLKSEEEELNDRISSLEQKICKYVQEGLEIAYERLKENSSATLYALARYDDSGIFLYFYYVMVSSMMSEKCPITMIRTTSDSKMLFNVDSDKIILSLPKDILLTDRHDVGLFADKIVGLCRKTIDGLRKGLEKIVFED